MTTKTKLAAALVADAKLADNAHAAERAAILSKIDTAEDLYGTALIEGLRMTVRYGLTSKDEVAKHYTRCGSPEVYASWFNRGHKAQQAVGEALALKAIDDACAGGSGGAMFVRARDALKAIVDAAKQSGTKQLTAKSAKAVVSAAVKSATAPKPKSEKSDAPKRGTKAQDEATLAQAAAECGKGHREMAQVLKLMSQRAHAKLVVPVGRESAHREALAALATAAEKFSVFLG